MIVLGISDNHGSGAALVRDGMLVAAVNQERLNREKNSLAFPWEAIDEVLKIGQVTPADVDLISVGSQFTPVFFLRLVKSIHQRAKDSTSQFSPIYDLYVLYHLLVKKIRLLRWVEMLLSRAMLTRQFQRRGYRCDIHLIEHHEAHAYSTYLTGPFEKAMVVTCDAMGDGVSATVGLGSDGRIRRVFEQDGRCAFNPYYSRITELLGFRPNRHEGKVTGLAAYGDPEKLLADFRRHAHFVGPGFSRFRLWTPRQQTNGFYGKIRHYGREDIAAAAQRNLEVQIGAFIRYWKDKLGAEHVTLAGGIFENVKLNQRVHEVPGVAGVYIFPNMSDGGLASGAALFSSRAPRRALESVFLGGGFDREVIEAAAARSGVAYDEPEDLAAECARLLADWQVVVRYAGRMEYGPRALGHRSILYRPDDRAINDWLNVKLRRTEFMPFAPVVRDERAAECFVHLDGAEFTARFMNVCFDCTPYMAEKCPGVVHVDGTARPQILRRTDDEEYYRLLEQFEALTGLPALVNTSFNMHEEPIVHTPDEAVRAFQQAELPYMALGPFLLRAEEHRIARRN
ncbi:MAG: carbamoyltransferase [Deltaproteobacteria bacterium]|nr:carbamoyltransferase [Deltaproteobacteria bacterium]